MKDKKYYWTLAILAVLLLFVVVCDAMGFVDGVVGLFTGGNSAQTQVVSEEAQDEAAEPVVEIPAETDEAVPADDASVPEGETGATQETQTTPEGAAE